ncbi:acyltransferase family protein [Xanthobacter flavus]|uniref:acyltransferase family protein n=1 Tax=Xanthobacter flavus TaxID=281 RepID=UPI00372B8085
MRQMMPKMLFCCSAAEIGSADFRDQGRPDIYQRVKFGNAGTCPLGLSSQRSGWLDPVMDGAKNGATPGAGFQMVNSSRPLSLGAKLELDDFRPSGFDFLRLILALSVLVPHAATIAQGEAFGEEFFNGTFAPYFQLVLPAFFILSGFLVSGSMFRSKTLVMFAGLRFIRIYPALMVEVILSAFIIGPLVTVLPLREYFTDPLFFRYLVNVTGHITYWLPGVFVNNPKPLIVNWQLWTVPWELMCYVAISILIVIGVKRRRVLVFPALGLLLFYCIFVEVVRPAMAGAHPFVALVGHVSGRELIVCFLLGVALFLYKDEIPWDWRLFVAALLLAVLFTTYIPVGHYIGMFFAAYATIFLGLCNPKRRAFVGLSDYSYGIYLYGYVIQQFIADVLPFSRVWYLNLLFAVPLSILCGVMSWHFVEKPAIKLRTHLKTLEEYWIRISRRGADAVRAMAGR